MPWLNISVHTTVLLQEAVDALAVTPCGIYVDGTFGRGGHSRLILERLGESGRLIAFDRDPTAFAAGQALNSDDARFCMVHSSFSRIEEVLRQLDVDQRGWDIAGFGGVFAAT